LRRLRISDYDERDLDGGILEKLSLELGSYLAFFQSSFLERTRYRKVKVDLVDSR